MIIITDFIPNTSSGGFAIRCHEFIESIEGDYTVFALNKGDFQTGNCQQPIEKRLLVYSNESSLLEFLTQHSSIGEIIVWGEELCLCLFAAGLKARISLFVGDPAVKVILLRMRWNTFHAKLSMRSKLGNIVAGTEAVLKNLLLLVKYRKYIAKLSISGPQHESFWRYILQPDDLDIISFEKKIKVNSFPLDHRKNDLMVMGKLGQIENLFAQKKMIKYIPSITSNVLALNEIKIVGNNCGILQELSELQGVNEKLKILGYVEDIDCLLCETKILWIPTETLLGVRTRAYKAWQYGMIVVAHESILAGIPESKSRADCFLYRTESELVDLLNEILI